VTQHLPIPSLDWEICPDGVEIVDLSPPRGAGRKGTIYEGIGGGRHFRFKSDRREPIRYPLTQKFALEDPLVVRFINATTDDALIKFFGRFGLTSYVGQKDETPVEHAIDLRDALTAALEKATSEDSGVVGPAVAGLLENIRLKPVFDYLGHRESARLALRTGTLQGFMAMEIALAALVGARLGRCKSCESFFLTGSMTDRRANAEFCDDKCRQRNHRNRKKEGANVNPKTKMEGRRRR
jgi:hypothetical protein